MQISKCHYWVTVWFTGCFCAIFLLSYSKAKYLYAGVRTCQTPPHTTAYVRYCHLAVFSPQRHTGPSSAEEGAQLHHLFLNFTSFKVIRVEPCEIHGSRGVTRLLLPCVTRLRWCHRWLLIQPRVLEVLSCCSIGQEDHITSRHRWQAGIWEWVYRAFPGVLGLLQWIYID